MEHNITFGERLQRLRKENGLSQEALSEKLSLTRQTISKWELNQSTPELEYIAQLSDIFRVSTDYLIKGTEFSSALNDARSASGENDPPEHKVDIKKYGSVFPAMLFSIGIVLLVLGVVGILVFIVLSAQNPWTHYENGRTYTGLIGFLRGNDIMRYFLSFCATALLGVIFTASSFIMRLLEKTQ